jgi:hypothetical protein
MRSSKESRAFGCATLIQQLVIIRFRFLNPQDFGFNVCGTQITLRTCRFCGLDPGFFLVPSLAW